MSGSVRKRSSKWDMRDNPEFAPDRKQLRSYLEGNDKLKSGMGFSSKEPFSRGRGSNKDDIMNKDYRDLDETMEWDDDGSYNKKFSPGFEEWKYKRHSQSPKNDRSMSGRSSRSRSPSHGFGRDSGFNDINRTRARGSSQPCREFAAGKCRRGNHCHFLHHDNQNYEDSWESKHREDGAPRYSALHDSRDHSHRSGRSNEACINFAKGRCRMGSSCNFVHNNSDGYSKGSVEESTRERENDRRRRDNSFDQGGGHGSNRSGPTPCKFFANGNCRNGKFCRFSHDRQAYGSPPNRRSRDDRWGSNPGGDHQTLDRPKLIDSASPTERLRDDRWGSDGNMVDRDNPKRNDTIAVSDTAKLVEDKCGNIGASDPGFTTWPTKDGWGHGLDKNREHGEPTFSSDKKETDYWMAENAGANMHVSQSIGTGSWSGDEMSPDWKYRVESSSHIQEEHGQNKRGITQDGTYLATEHEGTLVTPGQALNQNAQNINPLHSSSGHGVGQSQVTVPILPSRGVVESMHNQQVSTDVLPGQALNQNAHNINPLHSSSGHGVGQSQVAVPILPSRGVVHSTHNEQVSTDLPEQGFNQNAQNLPFHSSSGHAVRQSQVAVPILPSRGVVVSMHNQDVLPGQGFNHNAQDINPLHSSSGHAVGQNQVAVPILPSRVIVESMNNQEVSAEKKYTVEPNITDAGLSQVRTINPPTQNMVSNEQLAQLSNLSASLAHILGTGQQLPQLYAALNSNDAKDTASLAETEVPAIPVSNTFIKPDPVIGFRKQYDPMCDSVAAKNVDTSGATPDFSPSKKNAEDKVEIPSLVSNSGRQNFDDSFKAACSEEHLIQLQPRQNLELNKEKNEVVVEERQNFPGDHKNTKENGPSENMDQNGGLNDGKKSKDAKDIRAFKFALVEFVKELLKPAWKEGHINKEDYKAIVKKVVDKVTGTMQGANIPQTQEKIDHYLSFSKPKLSKLVQAYVEKVQKA